MLSPNKLAIIEYSHNSPRAKSKLKWEAHNGDDMEISTTITEESTASPADNHEAHQLECSGNEEGLDVLRNQNDHP